ncbi:MAG: hypothetical protein HS122_00180 [Opitutaceae bacterium]|nr:hypothetical protein [Opitutaceae bacterium]
MTAGIGYLGTNVAIQAAPLPGRRHEYAYDSIRNRQWSNSTGVSGLGNKGNLRELCRPFRALYFRFTYEPTALPWAGDTAPFQGLSLFFHSTSKALPWAGVVSPRWGFQALMHQHQSSIQHSGCWIPVEVD